MSDDAQTGIFVHCSAEELAAWETAAALEGRNGLDLEAWIRIQLDCRAAAIEARYTGERPDLEFS